VESVGVAHVLTARAGTAVLEYLLLQPLFAGIDGPGLVRFAELEDAHVRPPPCVLRCLLTPRQLMAALGPAASKIDADAVRLLRLVLCQDAVTVEAVSEGLVRSRAALRCRLLLSDQQV
jgi:hypothetical protein